MNTVNVIEKSGYEVWFTPGRAADPGPLISGLASLSSKPPYVPEQRSKLESLQLALSDMCREKSNDPYYYVVRTLSGRSGRHVFLESRGVDKNELIPLFVIHTPDSDTLVPEGEHLPSHETMDQIQSKFEHYLATLGYKAVKQILVKEVSRLGGVKIDGKDAYFIPPESKDEWEKVVSVVKNATASNDCKFYDQHYKLDGNALEAVQVSVEEEITAETDKMLSELAQGEYTDRVANNRLNTLKSLNEKIKRYESLFNSGLQSCSYRIAEVINAMNMGSAVEQQDVFEEALDLAI